MQKVKKWPGPALLYTSDTPKYLGCPRPTFLLQKMRRNAERVCMERAILRPTCNHIATEFNILKSYL